MLYDDKPKDNRQDIIKVAANEISFVIHVLQVHKSQPPPPMLPATLS